MLSMKRTPEQELMTDPIQAEAYARSDFSEPHNAFVERFRNLFPDFSHGVVLDIGCGNADPTIRFARAYPDVEVVGIDGAEAMLIHGKKAVEEAELSSRVKLINGLIGQYRFPHQFDAIICNSLLHQLHNPQVLWEALKGLAKPGAPIFIMDLTRPESSERAQELVNLHAKGAPEPMRVDFFNSLHAAFKPDEIREQIREAKLLNLQVEQVDDRHVVIFGVAA